MERELVDQKLYQQITGREYNNDYKKRTMRIFTFTILISAIFWMTGCGTSNSSDDNERYLQVEIIQRGLESNTTNPLGNYDVPITKNQISLENALQVDVSLKYRGAISPWRENGDPNKNVVVFFVSFDARMDGIFVNGDILSVNQVEEPINLEPTGEDVPLHEGRYYAFFVDGIGDRPDVPVQLALRGTDDIQMIEVDPAKHTLTGNYALHVNKNQLEIEDTGNRTLLVSSFNARVNEVLDSDRFVTFFRFTPQSPEQRDVFGGVARPGWGYAAEYDNESDFDFYVFSLK